MRLPNKTRAALTVLLMLASPPPCLAQSRETAIIRQDELFHPERGIKRLVRALKEADRDFFSLPPRAQSRQFSEMFDFCVPAEGERKAEGGGRVEEVVCPVLKDVADRADEFGMRRRLKHLVVIRDEAGLFKVDKLKDLTRAFVKEYNRRNP
jgi:hypothetical protein